MSVGEVTNPIQPQLWRELCLELSHFLCSTAGRSAVEELQQGGVWGSFGEVKSKARGRRKAAFGPDTRE
jgi:hypothetical protein